MLFFLNPFEFLFLQTKAQCLASTRNMAALLPTFKAVLYLKLGGIGGGGGMKGIGGMNMPGGPANGGAAEGGGADGASVCVVFRGGWLELGVVASRPGSGALGCWNAGCCMWGGTYIGGYIGGSAWKQTSDRNCRWLRKIHWEIELWTFQLTHWLPRSRWLRSCSLRRGLKKKETKLCSASFEALYVETMDCSRERN